MALSEDEQHTILLGQASATRTLHTPHRYPDGTEACAWCVERWPCSAADWADSLLGSPDVLYAATPEAWAAR